jgi:hypothetical protein
VSNLRSFLGKSPRTVGAQDVSEELAISVTDADISKGGLDEPRIVGFKRLMSREERQRGENRNVDNSHRIARLILRRGR